jgi:hypothetical protein
MLSGSSAIVTESQADVMAVLQAFKVSVVSDEIVAGAVYVYDDALELSVPPPKLEMVHVTPVLYPDGMPAISAVNVWLSPTSRDTLDGEI